MSPAAPLHLVLPGYQNSGPAHWQSRWEAADPGFVRVEQADWDAPRRTDWVAALDTAVAAADRPVVLVAHSLGCITVAHWAAGLTGPGRVVGALLVAPADVDTAEVPELLNFRPVPLRPLPFPTTVVASTDDPWCTAERAAAFADAWGAKLVGVGALGHINSDSGLGDWPEGRHLLADLTGTARP
ncbi:RBBP9/YdeN family alpha/beta hydrolase [Kitasatospora sp. DSM 101779]|uniref:RBBP9/YdeN family alpha/beta hydrolase n=1 Tax=Kitasatospora sp. DSM 101779 TaxID=2853165 RepID=UPI0021D9F2B8|nr:alpha/beta hydrolase [Kitasatospora sp. DSM 101779]MCU7826153.1 alpha/beta hydrolase [Kitasatospora sp. DSM 101779]